MPTSIVYSGEIRMYSVAMLLVTVMALYAYRICKDGTNKNWIIFTVFSLASAYTHYYALIAAVITNAILFIYLLFMAISKNKKEHTKLFTTDLKKFIIIAIIQIITYLPWIIFFISQYKSVSNGFWIPRPSLDTFLGIFNFQFSGAIGDDVYIGKYITYTIRISYYNICYLCNYT